MALSERYPFNQSKLKFKVFFNKAVLKNGISRKKNKTQSSTQTPYYMYYNL